MYIDPGFEPGSTCLACIILATFSACNRTHYVMIVFANLNSMPSDYISGLDMTETRVEGLTLTDVTFIV